LVIERKRAGQGFVDGLLWFCDNCNHKLHEVYFELNDQDFFTSFEHYYGSEDLRTLLPVTVMEVDPRFVAK
jgi:3-hydroxyanthranilate 3,4-dioxygenase